MSPYQDSLQNDRHDVDSVFAVDWRYRLDFGECIGLFAVCAYIAPAASEGTEALELSRIGGQFRRDQRRSRADMQADLRARKLERHICRTG